MTGGDGDADIKGVMVMLIEVLEVIIVDGSESLSRGSSTQYNILYTVLHNAWECLFVMTLPMSSQINILIGKDDVDDSDIALSDTQINSIQCLNFVKIWFNSIFNSKLFLENSIQQISQF